VRADFFGWLCGSALVRGDAAASGRSLPDPQRDGHQYLGGAAAGADQLGALVVPVGAWWDLEKHLAVAEDAA
jgi:hypothetical protein